MLGGGKSVRARHASGWLSTQDVDPSVDNVQLARHDVETSLQRLAVHIADSGTDSADQKQEREDGVESFHVISSTP